MNQLITLRVLCERCEKAEALLWCTAEREAYCETCDVEAHSTDNSAHVRMPISSGTAVAASCALCRSAPAAVYAAKAQAPLCDICADFGRKYTSHLQIGGKVDAEDDALLKDTCMLQHMNFERMDFSSLEPTTAHPSVHLLDTSHADLTNEWDIVGSFRRRIDLDPYRSRVPRSFFS